MIGAEPKQTLSGTRAATNRAMSHPKVPRPASLSLESPFFESSGLARLVPMPRGVRWPYVTRSATRESSTPAWSGGSRASAVSSDCVRRAYLALGLLRRSSVASSLLAVVRVELVIRKCVADSTAEELTIEAPTVHGGSTGFVPREQKTMSDSTRLSVVFSLTMCLVAVPFEALMAEPAKSIEPLQLGSRLELFVDDHLIDRMDGVRLELKNPVDIGNVMAFDQPWEGKENNYVHLFRDDDKWRMYYRAARWGGPEEKRFTHICYAESTDGLDWTKPHLGLHEFEGNKRNNITFKGVGGNKWFCFKDDNPAEPAQRRYKAFCGAGPGHGAPMRFLASPDGLNWSTWQETCGITGGPLDALNVVRWDKRQKRYLAFVRNWVTKAGGYSESPELDAPPGEYHTWWRRPKEYARAIAVSTSPDCVNWSPQQWLIYPPGTPIEQLYTNAATPYFRAPHFYLAFPMRFVAEREIISGWAGGTERGTKGASDAVFMSSRDGIHWDRRFLEGFLRPGLDPKNWTDRNMIISPGIVQTGAGEMSIYYVAHYKREDIHLRRCRLRLDGFVSVNAGYDGGEFVTKPLVFSGPGNKDLVLVINYSTSAVGDIRVEVQTPDGKPINGYALQDAEEMIGDQIEGKVRWKSGSDVSSLAGKPVRLRFAMKDADLYSIRAKAPIDPSRVRP